MCDCNKYVSVNKFNCKPKCYEKSYEKKNDCWEKKTWDNKYDDGEYDRKHDNYDCYKCKPKPKPCPRPCPKPCPKPCLKPCPKPCPKPRCLPSNQCDCCIYNCEPSVDIICPQVRTILEQLDLALNTGNTALFRDILSPDVVFILNFPGATPAFGIDAVIAAIAGITDLVTTFNFKANTIAQEDCWHFLQIGVITVTKCNPPITSTIPAIVRVSLVCENGKLLISRIECYGNFAPIFAPCPIIPP